MILAVGSLLVATTPAGCSFLFVTEAPPNHQKLPYFDCTSSRTLPVVDTVFAGIYGLAAVGNLAASNQSSSGSGSTYGNGGLATTLIPVAFAGLLAASAISGYSDTGKCREAKTALMERLMLRDQAAPAMTPGDPWLNPGSPVGGAANAPPPYPSAPSDWSGPATSPAPPTPIAPTPTPAPTPPAPTPPRSPDAGAPPGGK